MNSVKDHPSHTEFQTPTVVCKYMASLVPNGVNTVLEPTPGLGNLVKELSQFTVTAPDDFFKLEFQRFDCIVMNPPFSEKSAFLEHAPIDWNGGMKVGYKFLLRCLEMSDNVIALMPWFTISDSDVRLRYLKKYGLVSLTALPRKTFEYARIQTCVFHFQKGYQGETQFHVFDLLQGGNQLMI